MEVGFVPQVGAVIPNEHHQQRAHLEKRSMRRLAFFFRVIPPADTTRTTGQSS